MKPFRYSCCSVLNGASVIQSPVRAAPAGMAAGDTAVGHVEGETGEQQAADEVAERDRDLVPQPPVRDRHFGAHHHARRG